LRRTHHNDHKELLTPRQRRHRSSDCGSCSGVTAEWVPFSKISIDESCILRYSDTKLPKDWTWGIGIFLRHRDRRASAPTRLRRGESSREVKIGEFCKTEL
jgi:hypothetical protein